MKLIKYLSLILFLLCSNSVADINSDFDKWKKQFKTLALNNQISEKTFNLAILLDDKIY